MYIVKNSINRLIKIYYTLYLLVKLNMANTHMTPDERLNLKKIMTNMDYVDNTEEIRKSKHSVPIRNDIRRLETLKTTHAQLRISDHEAFFNIAHQECSFLFNNYIDLFTRAMKDEIDIKIMSKILIVLKLIEDDAINQEEGSVMVGRLLKELYLDSAVRHADNLDNERENVSIKVVSNEAKPISWKEFKRMDRS